MVFDVVADVVDLLLFSPLCCISCCILYLYFFSVDLVLSLMYLIL